ncbi:MAG: glycosyltransferase family 2 protein [Chitinophagaceae bacterium]|nr:MAG: glycosyltransferase family 2 protein [Chitinophagaceae bacterium]
MSWYKKYLSVYNRPVDSIPPQTISLIRNNLKRFRSDSPVASVVVIAHNEEKTLLSCLWSLSENICHVPVEIIGVNNNSTDRTAEIFEMLGVECFWESMQSCGYARQCGLNNARGKYYISIDSDIMYPPNYIQTLINRLSKSPVVAVSSRYSYIPSSTGQRIGFTLYELARDINIRLQSYNRPELSVRGGVFSYHAELGRKIGYRVDLKLGEDGSMAIGLKQYGKIKLIYERKARAVTFARASNTGKYLILNFKKYFLLSLKSPARYFIKKKVYKDHEANLINGIKTSVNEQKF